MFENQSNGTVSASEKVNKSKNYLEKIKNFKTLPPKEKRNLLIAGIVAIIVLVILIIIISSVGGGASNQTVSEASLAIAEQDYGYKLDLTDYEIKDHFTSDTEVPLTGKKLKEKVYYVILDANANDSNGTTVDTVKYLVCCIDPEKDDDVVTYSPYSFARDCTGMDDEAIQELIKTSSASLR